MSLLAPDVCEVLHRREPAPHEEVGLLAVVELREPLNRDAVELKVTGEAIEFLDELRELMANPAAAPEGFRAQQRSEKPHFPEGAFLRRVVVEREVPVDGRTLARQDSRYRSAAVAELHLYLPPVRQQVAQEVVSFDLLPPQRVDEDKDFYLVIHLFLL